MAPIENSITLAYMNIRNQTGLDIVKQVQIEHFLKFHKVDVLHCQEINIDSESFSHCKFLNGSYEMQPTSMEPALLLLIVSTKKILSMTLVAVLFCLI